MEKLYVNEIRPTGDVSTVGLFYSRAEAEAIVAKLQSIPERSDCRYEIVQAHQRYLDRPSHARGHPAAPED